MKYTHSGAEFSQDRVYRYVLWRRWAPGDCAMFIGLNPSTANEKVDDPTIRRCVDFAKKWGKSGIYMLNLFAFRATDPKEMKKAKDPFGPKNGKFLISNWSDSDPVVACWGTHGSYLGRGKLVSQILPGMKCFGLTKAGHPKHPLYLAKKTKLVDF